MRSRQLQSRVLAGIAILVAAVLISLVRTADHPVVAAGIVLQTMAGLFAAMQLWGQQRLRRPAALGGRPDRFQPLAHRWSS
jgi:hypothetical protein